MTTDKKVEARKRYLLKTGWVDNCGNNHTFKNCNYSFLIQYTSLFRIFIPSKYTGCFKENIFLGKVNSISEILNVINDSTK